MPSQDRLQALAERLTAVTERKKVKWTPAAEDSYRLSLPHGAVTVGRELHWLTFMNIYDEDGRFVESLDETASANPWDRSLQALVEAARNSALNIDVVLDTLLRDVEAADTAAPPPATDDDIPF